MKKNILFFVLGLIVAGSIGVYAASQILASDIDYKNGQKVSDALDDLYSNPATKKFCTLKEGTINTIGSKYECIVGRSNDQDIKYNFYLLAINNNEIKLIMDRNITQETSTTTMTWMDAMKYIDNNLITTWSNVLYIDLPMVQDIANAVGNTSWHVEDKNYDGWFNFDSSNGIYGQTQVASSSNLSNYRWLYNYTRECTAYGCDSATSLGSTEAYGYWARDIIAQQKDSTARAWGVGRGGGLAYVLASDGTTLGVRPVITVLKSNLSN